MNVQSRWLLCLVSLFLTLGCSACAEQQTGSLAALPEVASDTKAAPAAQPVAPPVSAPSLPAPAGLASAKPRQTRFVEADLVKNASDFELTLPHVLVTADGADNDFSPSAAGNGLAGCAYCIYRFTAPGYDRNAQIRADWSTPADDGGIFFGVANFDTNRWDWFHGSAEPKLNLPARSPYFSPSDELLVVVLCNGEAQRLTSLRIGSLPPVASQTLNINKGFVPVTGRFDASASSDPDGVIVGYDWDMDGDGSFEVSNGTEPTHDHSFENAGFFPGILRVRDDDGLSATVSSPFTACAEWTHSLGASSQTSFTEVVYDGHGGLYAAGYINQGSSTDVLLARYDLAGNILWCRAWDGGSTERADTVHISADGLIFVTGVFDVPQNPGTRQNLLVQSWSPEGELLLSRCFDNADQILPDCTLQVGDSCVICGNYASFNNLCLVSINTSDGSLEWLRAWTVNSTDSIFMDDMAISSQFVLGGGVALSLTAVGMVNYITGSRALAVHFDNAANPDQLDLAFTQQMDANNSQAGSVIKRNSLLVDTIVAGSFSDGSSGKLFVSNLKTGGTPNATWNTGTGGGLVSGMASKPGGDISVIGERLLSEGTWINFPSVVFPSSADLYTDNFVLFDFNTDLLAIAGICGVAGGTCLSADMVTSSSIVNSGGPENLSWSSISLSEVSVGSLSSIDVPGTVDTDPVIVLDSGGGQGDALLMSRGL